MPKKSFPPTPEGQSNIAAAIKRRGESEPEELDLNTDRDLTNKPFKIITYGNINHRKLKTQRQEMVLPAEIAEFIDANLDEYGNRSVLLLKMLQLGYEEIKRELPFGDYEIKI